MVSEDTIIENAKEMYIQGVANKADQLHNFILATEEKDILEQLNKANRSSLERLKKVIDLILNIQNLTQGVSNAVESGKENKEGVSDQAC